MIPEIHIEDYNYPLPDERIAKYPLEERDSSKLLCYRGGEIQEHIFRELPGLLDPSSMMVFNDTKVVPARLFFRKDTGALIEVFCLEPVRPCEYATMFTVTDSCRWKCIVGNAKRWKGGQIRHINPDNDPSVAGIDLRAELISREGQTAIVELTWSDGSPFSAVLEKCGCIPIPPYLNRETERIDYERYQTLYAKFRGSVAAPTAGLHFSKRVLDGIRERGIDTETVCLHVGAGTFLPVKDSLVSRHIMHREPFVVKTAFLEKLLGKIDNVTAVGTTSVRTLESLYYAGVHCIEEGKPADVSQWEPYTRDYTYTTEEALSALYAYLKGNSLTELDMGTGIIIVPGFRFRLVRQLITNFHQPQSTLLLLISAFVGGNWKPIYDYALNNGFRFLSYGDSSLLSRAE